MPGDHRPLLALAIAAACGQVGDGPSPQLSSPAVEILPVDDIHVHTALLRGRVQADHPVTWTFRWGDAPEQLAVASAPVPLDPSSGGLVEVRASGLEPGQTYFASLRATDATGASVDSAPWAFRTRPEPVYPAPPKLTQEPLSSIHFVNEQRGWAVGWGPDILHTRDGGQSWHLETTGVEGYQQLYSVAFADENNGLAVGDQGLVLRTTSAGAVWTPVTAATAKELRAVAFATPLDAFIVGADGLVLASHDRGQTWVAQPALTGRLNAVSFLDSQHGWIAGSGGIWRTLDGGATWLPAKGGASGDLTSICFWDASRGIAGGFPDAEVLLSEDGGATWTLRAAARGVESTTYGVACAGPSTGYAVGDGVMLRSGDGGRSWQEVDPGSRRLPYTGVAFVTPERGWIVDLAGNLRSTADGGQSFRPESANPSYALLTDIAFSDERRGVIVGLGGEVLRTSDGGSSWTRLHLAGAGDLFGVSFVDARTGWIAGDRGALWQSRDGGETWAARDSGTTAALNDVLFVDDEAGFAVGSGTVIRTLDGGASWAPVPVPTRQYLYAIRFVDAERGYVAGSNWSGPGVLLETRDRGASFAEVSLAGGTPTLRTAAIGPDRTPWLAGDRYLARLAPELAAIAVPADDHDWEALSLQFSDGGEGWMAGLLEGPGGAVWHTADGGHEWSLLGLASGQFLYGIASPGPARAWAVGDLGTIVLATARD